MALAGHDLTEELSHLGWQLHNVLGHSPTSVVYRAERDGVSYALKIMREGQDAAAALEAYRREAAMLVSVGHPSLPTIYEVATAGHWPYMAMELLDGKSLGRALSDGPLDVDATARIGLQVAEGLAAAHRSGLVHRDMKPDNIMLEESGRARIIDFGLAGTTTTNTTAADAEVVGTLRYSAPEQAGMLKRPVDHRSDLYSLGVVMFECLVGYPPFRTDDVGELLRAHAVTVPPRVATLRDGVPAELDDAIAQLLAKDPDDRYQTADALVATLHRSVHGDTGTAVPDGSEVTEATMIGRRAEITTLHDAWRQTRAGTGRVALVTGGSGTGKSRLAREIVAQLRNERPTDPPVVLCGRATPGDPTPFATLRAAVDGHLRTVQHDGDAGLTAVRQAAEVGGPAVAALSPRLAALLGHSGEGTTDDQDQFASAAAEFLLELARRSDGLLLWLDDVQWVDAASLSVLRRLAGGIRRAPLLLLGTGRDDAENAPVVEELRTALDPAVTVTLAALDEAEIAALIADRLGGPVTDAAAARLGTVSRGNPFALVEYLWTLVRTGLVTPSWGRIVVDLDGMDRLDLPLDVFDLITAHIDQLTEGRELLVTAAAIGNRFELDTLARVAGVPADQAFAAVSEAVDNRLVEATGGNCFRFVHDRVQHILLERVEPAELRDLHQRIAETLDPHGDLDGLDRPRLYELARQYGQGDVARTPRRVYETCWAAGTAAMAETAVAEAVGFLEAAEAAARTGGFEPDPLFLAEIGATFTAAGRLDDAADRLNRALEAETDVLRRSYILDELARAEYTRPNYAAAIEYGRRALAEIGKPMARGRVGGWAMSLWALVQVLVSLHPWFFGTARGAARDRHLAHMRHGETTGRCALYMEPTSVVMALALRVVHSANRVGHGSEYVMSYLVLSGLCAWLGLPRVSAWTIRRAQAAADELADPRAQARIEVMHGYNAEFLGDPVAGERHLRRAMEQHGRWLPVGLFIEVCTALTILYDQRGYSRKAEPIREIAHTRGLPQPTFLYSPAVIDDKPIVQAQLDWVDVLISLGEPVATSVGAYLWGAFLGAGMNIHVERGRSGPELDRMIAEFHRFAPPLQGTQCFFKRPWQVKAYGRLAQVRAASAEDRPAALALATQAVTDLGRLTVRAPVMRGHHLVARADLELLKGHPERALRLVTAAERVADRYDAPYVRFEAGVVRARALSAQGHTAAAIVQARMVLGLADREGWVHRAERVRRDLLPDDLANSTAVSSSAMGLSVRSIDLTGTNRLTDLHNRRHLEALMQVSAAASSVLEPRALTRTVLDEILKILGAERAYLFTCPSPEAPLERYAGRDSDGNDLDDLVGYSTTVVERARTEGRAMVVTGTEEGEAVSSHSAVAHGLRSIMVAPLQLEGRVRGVVYLDSRVAKGIFAQEDEQILVAIASMLASSLETARAAQLELTVQAERQQRGLADALRDAGAKLSRILDPDDVLAQTLHLVAETVQAQAGCVLLHDDDGLRVTTVHGLDVDGSAGTPRLPASSSLMTLTDPLVAGPGERLPDVLHTLLDRPTGWFAVPLVSRDGLRAVLVLVPSTADDADADAVPDEGLDAKAGIAAAFAGNAVIAYDNALLFREVQLMATTDGLTGLLNRRHFMDLAGRELAAAHRHDAPLAAIMLDIDHFKKINDTHGHGAGDDVIRTVAQRLAACVRHEDLVGRYGGEEFVLVCRNDQDGAVELAERLREAVEGSPIPSVAGDLRATISVGVSMVTEADALPDTVLARADAALYQAKQGGRNQVAFAGAMADA